MSSYIWAVRASSTFHEGIMPPTIVDITHQLEDLGTKVAYGGTCDIYRGRLKNGRVVAIKRPRTVDSDPDVLRVSGLLACVARNLSTYLSHRLRCRTEIQSGGADLEQLAECENPTTAWHLPDRQLCPSRRTLGGQGKSHAVRAKEEQRSDIRDEAETGMSLFYAKTSPAIIRNLLIPSFKMLLKDWPIFIAKTLCTAT